jgi:hypothetical protein
VVKHLGWSRRCLRGGSVRLGAACGKSILAEIVRIFIAQISRRPCPQVGVAGGVRDGAARVELRTVVQAGLVAFDGQDPACAAFGEVGDVVTLTVQSVDDDHEIT